jgi:hypothetical protein
MARALPADRRRLAHLEHVIPFLALPGDLRPAVYTTNTIEGLHRQIRKAIKIRGHFHDGQVRHNADLPRAHQRGRQSGNATKPGQQHERASSCIWGTDSPANNQPCPSGLTQFVGHSSRRCSSAASA